VNLPQLPAIKPIDHRSHQHHYHHRTKHPHHELPSSTHLSVDLSPNPSSTITSDALHTSQPRIDVWIPPTHQLGARSTGAVTSASTAIVPIVSFAFIVSSTSTMAATTKATSKVNKTKGMPPRAAKPGSAKLPASSAVKKTTATPKKKAGLLKGQTKLSINVSPPVQVPTNPPTPPPRPEVNKFTYAEVAKSPGRGEVPKSIDVEMNSPARSIASVGSQVAHY
jgi:hypothetical protein